ncbi:MAG TPA: hypothetical protein VMT88_13885, partial [Actinomycetes bacterium]|nr:hypothetical protein [Actinomycetes bacterium]
MNRQLLLLSVPPLVLGLLVPLASASDAASGAAKFQIEAASGGGDGTLGIAAARAMSQGYLVPDQARYERAKAQAAKRLSSGSTKGGPTLAAPATLLRWDGLTSPGHTPSDSTGAIGTTRFIETVNAKVGIYDRAGALVNSDSLSNFWQESGNNNFDPQIMWDAKTKRFYYAGDSVASATDNRLAYGFSKTASPNNATSDWCHYQVGYGSD